MAKMSASASASWERAQRLYEKVVFFISFCSENHFLKVCSFVHIKCVHALTIEDQR